MPEFIFLMVVMETEKYTCVAVVVCIIYVSVFMHAQSLPHGFLISPCIPINSLLCNIYFCPNRILLLSLALVTLLHIW